MMDVILANKDPCTEIPFKLLLLCLRIRLEKVTLMGMRLPLSTLTHAGHVCSLRARPEVGYTKSLHFGLLCKPLPLQDI